MIDFREMNGRVQGRGGRLHLREGVSVDGLVHWDVGARTHLDGPSASTGADVQYPAWVFQRCEIVAVVEESLEDLILQIEALDFVLASSPSAHSSAAANTAQHAAKATAYPIIGKHIRWVNVSNAFLLHGNNEAHIRPGIGDKSVHIHARN